MNNMSYKKLSLTMILSFIVMYFVMFLNMDTAGDYHTSLTRIYMSLLMVSPMAVIMVVMMRKMYPDKKKNTIIITLAIIIFAGTLWALRTQQPIGDVQYMKAMIPHHSSAIMTSKHADIRDPEVKQLSQQKEIHQMEQMLRRLKQ